MAELDLSSPSVRAAMRVLGVLKAEVAPLDRAAFEGNDMRYQHHERKRQNLIEEVRRKASDGPEVSGKVGDLGAETRDAKNAAFMDEVVRAEQANMMMMQKLAKK